MILKRQALLLIFLSFYLSVTIVDATAQNVKLRREGQNGVIVWKSASAAREGNKLRQGGVETDLLIPLVACVVEPWTQAVVVRDDGYFKTVLVSHGDNQGCRGTVSPGDIFR